MTGNRIERAVLGGAEAVTGMEERHAGCCAPAEEADGCPACRTKERSDEEVRALMNRLSRIEGQIRGIKGMLEENRYCVDILTQSGAVTAAMNAFNKELLASHIRTCVAEDIRAGSEETIEELVKTIQKLMK